MSPSVIIFDLRMPKMSGLEFLNELNLKPSDPVSVIVLTGHGNDAEAKACYEAGITSFLRKPFNFYDLRGAIKVAITSKMRTELLEELVQERTAELEKVNEQLLRSQKLESVGRLAGGIAHDFNNMLTPILSYTQMAIDKLPTADPLRSSLVEVEKAAERASDLVRQLLAFSRRPLIETKVINLNKLVLDIDRMLRRVVGEDVELVRLSETDLGLVRADTGHVEQVIMNLAVNVRDAMPEGGRLTIETANVLLDEAYANNHPEVTPGKYIMLAVSDTGTGMTEEVRARIFEPFFTTKVQGKGTGLGLSTCYSIVKQSGGHIFVYSEQGQGTAFKIYFPQVEGESKLKSQSDKRGTLRGGSETILLAEDEESVRFAVSAMLGALGYTVLEAENGAKAMEIAHDRMGEAIDLLLTDVVMPFMSGKELADLLSEQHPETSVLFTSGFTDDRIVGHGVLEAETNFIPKPFSHLVLAGKVREVLENGCNVV